MSDDIRNCPERADSRCTNQVRLKGWFEIGQALIKYGSLILIVLIIGWQIDDPDILKTVLSVFKIAL